MATKKKKAVKVVSKKALSNAWKKRIYSAGVKAKTGLDTLRSLLKLAIKKKNTIAAEKIHLILDELTSVGDTRHKEMPVHKRRFETHVDNRELDVSEISGMRGDRGGGKLTAGQSRRWVVITSEDGNKWMTHSYHSHREGANLAVKFLKAEYPHLKAKVIRVFEMSKYDIIRSDHLDWRFREPVFDDRGRRLLGTSNTSHNRNLSRRFRSDV